MAPLEDRYYVLLKESCSIKIALHFSYSFESLFNQKQSHSRPTINLASSCEPCRSVRCERVQRDKVRGSIGRINNPLGAMEYHMHTGRQCSFSRQTSTARSQHHTRAMRGCVPLSHVPGASIEHYEASESQIVSVT